MPVEAFQISKIAKLLLKMEKGVTKEDQGKTLDEIDMQITMDDEEPVTMDTENSKNKITEITKYE